MKTKAYDPKKHALVAMHFGGQSTHYYLVDQQTGQCASTLPRDKDGNVLLARKQVRKLSYGEAEDDKKSKKKKKHGNRK